VRRPQYEQREIKKQIKNSVLMLKPFKDFSRREAFNSWEKAFKEGKLWAKKVLDDVVETQKQDFPDL
jgi:hypothetical protein